MFDLSTDDRLSAWADLREQLEVVDNPLQTVWDFWTPCPFVPYNNNRKDWLKLKKHN